MSDFDLHLVSSFSAVICSFRGSVTQGLALEVGETVQILEKCEGETQEAAHFLIRVNYVTQQCISETLERRPGRKISFSSCE